MNKIIERSNDLLSKQLSFIFAADNKVAPIFAINTAMLGVLAALIPPIANWTDNLLQSVSPLEFSIYLQ